MRVLGNRVLLERVAKEETSGFETVDVLDDFVSKGKIAQVGGGVVGEFAIGMVVLFAKFSPDTQEVKVEGRDMKAVKVEDIIAIL